MLHYLLSDNEDKRGVSLPTLQMGWEWTIDRGRKEGLTSTGARNASEQKRCARRTVLITLAETAGAVDHVEALADAHVGKAEMDIHIHTSHNAFKQWDDAAIDHVDEAREKAHKATRETSSGDHAKAAVSNTKKKVRK